VPSLRFEKALWDQGFTRVVGVDEVGMATLAGPVVAAACLVTPDVRLIRDSLRAHGGRRVADGRYAVTRITPDRFNTLSTQMKSEGKNLNTLLAWGHARSIEDLLLKVGERGEPRVGVGVLGRERGADKQPSGLVGDRQGQQELRSLPHCRIRASAQATPPTSQAIRSNDLRRRSRSCHCRDMRTT